MQALKNNGTKLLSMREGKVSKERWRCLCWVNVPIFEHNFPSCNLLWNGYETIVLFCFGCEFKTEMENSVEIFESWHWGIDLKKKWGYNFIESLWSSSSRSKFVKLISLSHTPIIHRPPCPTSTSQIDITFLLLNLNPNVMCDFIFRCYFNGYWRAG